jgi:cytochrome c oxidase cbb3-type subunit 3
MKLSLLISTSFLALVLSSNIDAATFNAAKTFDKKCSSCHWIGEDDIGPNLVGVTKRRMKNKKTDWKWITSFIQNSQKLIKSGDKQALATFNKFKKRTMPNQKLTDAEIKKIVAYIEAEGVKLEEKAKKAKKK